ncbi:MAG: hypothetical protein KKF74_05135 [Nanoarchaeota archaeon]|nr:hypothetical protein [Nanoarchaeota archaeon]
MVQDSLLKTGVDRLVSLIQEKKRISVPQAAKELGVSPVVVEEWADFLEEESIISTDYKFATLWLIERKLTKKDVEEKIKSFHGKKEIIIRKAESLSSFLDKNGDNLSRIRDEFKSIKEHIHADAGKVRKELEELERYTELKKNIDDQVKMQDQQFTDKIKEMDRQIVNAQKKYEDILRKIGIEEKMLRAEKLKEISTKKSEEALKQKLEKINKITDRLNERLKLQDASVEDSEFHIENMKKLAESTKKTLTEQKNKMLSLAKESKEHEKKILNSQQEILRKVFEKSRMMEKTTKESKMLSDKFKKFFEKKMEAETLLNKIDDERNNLKKELNDLISKARAFTISSQSTDVEKHVKLLEKKIKDIDTKKGFFEKEIKKLCGLIKKKDF